jgi:hypothetical protein
MRSETDICTIRFLYNTVLIKTKRLRTSIPPVFTEGDIVPDNLII